MQRGGWRLGRDEHFRTGREGAGQIQEKAVGGGELGEIHVVAAGDALQGIASSNGNPDPI
jgi:hypothetical protein